MKNVTLYRRDFKKTSEADFFEDVLQSLGIPQNIWEDIDHVELSVEDWILQQA
jgi:hypothetical protein